MLQEEPVDSVQRGNDMLESEEDWSHYWNTVFDKKKDSSMSVDNEDDDFPNYGEYKVESVDRVIKSGPRDLDSESLNGDTFPPICSPEDLQAIRDLYAKNPKLNNIDSPASVNFEFDKNQGYMIGSNIYNVNEAWIQTFSGKRFNPTKPLAQAIVIQDIAHALANQCRFSGHCKKFYSVAQHCVLVSHICNFEDALWGLLHDASEAYLVDVPRPLKQSGKFSSYIEFEGLVMQAICERFNLPTVEPESVKKADKILLATEARDLMAPLRSDWIQPTEPLPFKIESWSPEEAELAFATRFFKLIDKPTLINTYTSNYLK